jgi:hypothetical protein
MGRGRGRPPKPPGEALSEVLTLSVSPGTRDFFVKCAALLHSKEITSATLMRAVLERFRVEVEGAAEDAWLQSLNHQMREEDER